MGRIPRLRIFEDKILCQLQSKKRYTISSMGLVAYNKLFLYAAVVAPGITHDATRSFKIQWYLREVEFFKNWPGDKTF